MVHVFKETSLPSYNFNISKLFHFYLIDTWSYLTAGEGEKGHFIAAVIKRGILLIKMKGNIVRQTSFESAIQEL